MNETVRRYPLEWPTGWPRTKYRKSANFAKGARQSTNGTGRIARTQLTVWDATNRLQAEIGRLGVTHEVLSTNVETKLDGMPRSGTGEPKDPGAAIYFAYKGRATVLACDRWARVADNIAAIAAHIDALRRIERYGVGRLEQALAGYVALPADPTSNWWIVLGVGEDATEEQIDRAFKEKAREAHPDKPTGSHSDMSRLTTARAAARAR